MYGELSQKNTSPENWSSPQSPGLGLPLKSGMLFISSLDKAAEGRIRPWGEGYRGEEREAPAVSLKLKSLPVPRGTGEPFEEF